jgi:hypothetical protein
MTVPLGDLDDFGVEPVYALGIEQDRPELDRHVRTMEIETASAALADRRRAPMLGLDALPARSFGRNDAQPDADSMAIIVKFLALAPCRKRVQQRVIFGIDFDAIFRAPGLAPLPAKSRGGLPIRLVDELACTLISLPHPLDEPMRGTGRR